MLRIIPLLAFLALAANAARPNILYLYVDDMGWGSIRPNGQAARKAAGKPYVRTPHLDRLAAEGANFTRAYGCTVCSPARSSQQSGFHQGHTFADRNDPDNAKKALRTDDKLMGDVLSAAGYNTGYWGKWGYGGSKSQNDPVIENVQTLPTSHGYTEVVAELHHVRAHTFYQPTLWHAPANGKGGMDLIPNSMAPYANNAAYPNAPVYQNHPAYPKTAYCDDVYAFAALDFVRKHAKTYRASGTPFFGLLAVQVPHAPFAEVAKLPKWDAAYRDDPHFASLKAQSRQWAAMVTRIDAHFGHILNALEDPNGDGDRSDSVARDTLVIFQSDNGGPQHDARKQFSANGGLRGSKGQIYEGGIRVPTIMRWPGKIKAGSTHDAPVDVSDLLPTFCELAGVPTPIGLDGVSLAPTLRGSGHQRPREFLIHEAGKSASIIYGRHKLVLNKGGSELYDLHKDSAESTDLARKQPALAAKLKAILLAERVTEERGFANTYHRWTGTAGGSTADADNWSDYIYENAGITYTTDAGAPQLSWTATMDSANEAKASADLAFLGLEITGQQVLSLAPDITLTARNELRISGNATLNLAGGTASSLRWVELMKTATLRGSGKVDADLYTQGTLALDGPMQVSGTARLGGTLTGTTLKPGKILTAAKVEGRFTNKSVAGLRISYSDTGVTLSKP